METERQDDLIIHLTHHGNMPLEFLDLKQDKEWLKRVIEESKDPDLLAMYSYPGEGGFTEKFQTQVHNLYEQRTRIIKSTQVRAPRKKGTRSRDVTSQDMIVALEEERRIQSESIIYQASGPFTPLIVSPLPSGKYWILLKDFSYTDTYEELHETYTVPKGFITDFASVPRLFWTIYPKTGKYTKAAVLHDFLYFMKDVPKKRADCAFLRAMKDCGVGKFTRRLMYTAVRVFGQKHKFQV